MMHRLDISIIPVLVGALDADAEQSYGSLLAPYLSRPDTITVASSDFCHWCVSMSCFKRFR